MQQIAPCPSLADGARKAERGQRALQAARIHFDGRCRAGFVHIASHSALPHWRKTMGDPGLTGRAARVIAIR